MKRGSRRVPDAYLAGCSHVAGLVNTERTGFADQPSIQISLPYLWDGPFFSFFGKCFVTASDSTTLLRLFCLQTEV